MESQKVDLFLSTNAKYFHDDTIGSIRQALVDAPDSKWMELQAAGFKDPIIMLIVSIVGGTLGIDRFLVGDTTLGILKLITCGGLGVWQVVDWFLIMGVTKDKNAQKLAQII